LDQMEDSINAEDKVVKLDCSVNKKEKKVWIDNKRPLEFQSWT
jgi:hypothetical protein